MNWPNCFRQLCVLLGGIQHPILQAPMAGIQCSPNLAIAVANGGGLGSLPCANLSKTEIEHFVKEFRAATGKNIPLNLNFFCHQEPALPDPEKPKNEQSEEAKETMARIEGWRQKLEPFYAEMGIPPPKMPQKIESARKPMDDEMCSLVEMLRPRVVSFHFGMPKPSILERIKRIGAAVLCSATTVEEAKWLEREGADAIIAQGAEAGGHRGMFLGNLEELVNCQMGTMALVPEIVDNVRIPVIAAGGIVDGKGIEAALAMGASGVQIGTAFMFAAESECHLAHKRQLMDEARNGGGHRTAMTNLFTGRPARSLVGPLMKQLGGPIGPSKWVPPFPLAPLMLAPLRREAAKKDKQENGASNLESKFMPLYSGQGFALARKIWGRKDGKEFGWSGREMVEQMAKQTFGKMH